MEITRERCIETATTCRYYYDCNAIAQLTLVEADRTINDLQHRGPAPPTPPRLITSTACQTSTVETQVAIGPNAPIPGPPTGATVNITALQHHVYKGALRNVNRLAVAQSKHHQECVDARASGHQEMAQALAATTAERDALREEAARARTALDSMTAERAALQQGAEDHKRELAHATTAGRLLADYHADIYGQVVGEMTTLTVLGVTAEAYPPAKTFDEFLAIAKDKDPSV